MPIISVIIMDIMKSGQEYKNYLNKINKDGCNENNIFFTRHYGHIYGLIKYFKDISKYRYHYINELAEYITYSDKYGPDDCNTLFTDSFNYSFSLKEHNANIKINKLTIMIVIKYCDDNFIKEFLDKTDGRINYDDVCQLAIDAHNFSIVKMVFDKIKLTDEQFNEIFNGISSIVDMDYMNKDTAEELLNMCIDIGMFPKEDLVYNLLDKGIKVNEIILGMYNVVNDNNLKYIISKIRSGNIDFRKEKSKKYNFNEQDKNTIKLAILENINHYNEKHLDLLSKMFDIKYDKKCLEIYCKKPIDHKVFNYFIDQHVEPDYEMMCKIVNKLGSLSQIKKYFTKYS